MGKWRLYNPKSKKSFDAESRHGAIRKLVDLSKEDPKDWKEGWENFFIQKFVDGEWASDFGAYYEAEDIVENGEEEIECDFDPPCESCQKSKGM